MRAMRRIYSIDGHSKKIRFIDSNYNTFFEIPDSSYVKITYHNGEEVLYPCFYIDDYHFRMGLEVFHICQFAELMERNGNKYEPEDPITDEKVAWKVGSGHILTIQKCDTGYEYSIFDAETDFLYGIGQIDNLVEPHISMAEVRSQITKTYAMLHSTLRVIDYDEYYKEHFD